MKYRNLGKTGINISEITFGCWELAGGHWEKQEDEINIRALHKAFDLGITTFDTAEGYGQGHSEKIVGLALADKRKDIILSTKVSPQNLHAASIRTSVEKSLKGLQTDYVDIYYIHWPNKDIPLEETMGEMNRLKEAGLIRFIGASNFSIDQLKEAMQYGRIDVIQPEYSLLHRGIEKEIVPYCEEQSIGIMSYSSVAKGILTGAYHYGNGKVKETDFRNGRRLFMPEHLEKETELVDLIRKLAEGKGATMAEIAIGWLLSKKAMTSAIVGTQNEKHLMHNAKAVDLVLAASEIEALDEVSARVIASIDA